LFEHVVLRKANDGNPISAGNIAEALLYYQKVHLFIDRNTLFGLIRQLGANEVLSLVARHDLSAVYCEEMLGTQTQTFGATEFHSVASFRLAGTPDTELKTPHERMQAELEFKSIVPKSDAKRFADQFFKRVPIRRFTGNHFVKDGIHELAFLDFLDVDYLKQALRTAIAIIPGGYDAGDEFKVEIFKSDTNGVSIFTNIDFDSINKRREKFDSNLEALKLPLLLTNIIDARADIVLSSFYGGESALPSKSIRYVLTLGLDAVNPVSGIVAGFVDNFVIDKLLSGWRPNHFVSTNLVPFVRGY